MSALADVRPAAHPASRSRWADAAALGMVLAGAGHVVAALEHLDHGLVFAAFFLTVGVAQLGLGPALRKGPRPATVGVVLAGTIGLLLLYVVSRTVVLDLGPHSDRPEDPDALGTAVVIVELVTVTALPTLLPAPWRRAAVDTILAVGAAVWLAWFTGLIG
ncbi:hypothetical protein GCM10009609_00700 [Pseudonocardia aurantiaca]|uniref:Uncharacterized protein n=1 Tax=Pseudonocardia aurantiaca TaxID=75290 RepID=A0ABW4FD13_9PSEU